MLGLQPAVVRSCEFLEWSAFNHRSISWAMPVFFRAETYGHGHELEIETIETHRF